MIGHADGSAIRDETRSVTYLFCFTVVLYDTSERSLPIVTAKARKLYVAAVGVK